MNYDEFRSAMLSKAEYCADRAGTEGAKFDKSACISFGVSILCSVNFTVAALLGVEWPNVAFGAAVAALNLFGGLMDRRSARRWRGDFLDLRSRILTNLDEETREHLRKQEEWGKLREDWREEEE